MVQKSDFRRISDVVWEIPKEYRPDMTVPARLYASERMLDHILKDRSIEQLVNSATLPGLIKYAIAMPDIHQGYGFPIGGVVASRTSDGVISPGAIGYDINCLAGDTLVLHQHGYTRRIDEMADTWRDATLTCFRFDEPQRDTARPVLWFGQPPQAPVFRLTTETGREIVATADHPFWTEDGMIPLEKLAVGDRIALYFFQGVPYEAPSDTFIVTEEAFTAYLRELGKSEAGNAIPQILNHLRRRGLLPLRYSSPPTPYLCKLLGFLFGDGTVRFDRRSGKGVVAFYGEPEDLEEIRADLMRIGFKPSRVWTRERAHAVRTTYGDYEFERTETWFTVNSTALAALLAFLGAPVGRKATQDYEVPAWLASAPRWQKRLFLAALFGAELTAPQTVSGHGYNFAAPVLSLNKREGHETSGRVFLQQIADWLQEFGVATRQIAMRPEQVNADGRRSIRLRLVIQADPENLTRLWSTVGYEYNRKRRALAAVAVQYLAYKQRRIAARQAVAEEAVALAEAGHATGEIVAQLAGPDANRRFIERSLYEGRRTAPRVGEDFPTFEAFRAEVTEGLGDSGMVWERIASIEPVAYEDLVYDFTVDHPDHNFVANGFVVSNCGVRLLGTYIDREELGDALADLATAIYKNCPSGVGKGGHVPLTVNELEELMVEGARWALRRGFAREEDLPRTEESGRLEGADPSKVSQKAKKRGKDQVGTLGAGNHFIELDEVVEVFDEEAANAMGLFPGQVVVQIHCGSRGFGHQICTDYVRIFQGSLQKYGIKLPDRELVYAPINSPEGQDYLAAMKCAANYAFANRQVLTFHVRRSFEEALAGKVSNWDVYQVYDIAHNMGKIEVHKADGEEVEVCVHRKGATRAFGPGFEGLPPEYRPIGQPVLVPGSMGTASWVLVGTPGSMAETFGSTCHGAGRMMSRTKAKKTIWGAELRDELQGRGIEVRAGSMAGLAEEAPIAYKDVDEVVEVVHKAGIAKKVAKLVPIAVIKG
jgi:tRNA-splicing ligase RtcB